MSDDKIDLRKLNRYLHEGKSGRECAQIFKVSDSAISKAKKKLRNTIVRTVALEKAHEVVEDQFDMMDQLRTVNRAINEELNRAKEAVESDECINKVAVQEVIIKLCAEVRKQLDSGLRIAETWHNIQVYQDFQKEVLGILEEFKPGVRDEVIKRLKQKSVLRGLVNIN